MAYFIPPQGGNLETFGSGNRNTDNVFVEWDRNLIYSATDTGLYVLATPALGAPKVQPMPVHRWSLKGLNAGHDDHVSRGRRACSRSSANQSRAGTDDARL